MIRKASLTLLSTLAVLTVLLWIRSHGNDCYGELIIGERFQLGVMAIGGTLQLTAIDPRQANYGESCVSPVVGQRGWPKPIEFNSGMGWAGKDSWQLIMRLWVPFLVLGAWPFLSACRLAYRRLRRGTEPRCGQCGYNLTGNVSGVCPECGVGIDSDQRLK